MFVERSQAVSDWKTRPESFVAVSWLEQAPHRRALVMVRSLLVLKRLLFSLATLSGVAGDILAQDQVKPAAAVLPLTGKAQLALHGVEQIMIDFMTSNAIPGGVLAVAYQGRLVYERGFGYADLGTDKNPKVGVLPTSRFRIASISKPLTAVAVLRLVQAGKLRLDAKVYDLLKPEPLEKEVVHPRFKQVTVLQLLQHRGGWNRDAGFDPMFRSHIIAAAAGRKGPAEAEDIIRYMVSRQPESVPGEFYSYSNFGYCLLGRVIEKASGQSYEAYMRSEILAPLGLQGLALGRTREAQRLPQEVKYYGQDWRLARSVFAPQQGLSVRWQYGGFYLEAMDSHGAWISTAHDLLKLACDLDGRTKSRLLSPSSIETMLARPPGLSGSAKGGALRPYFYACGWAVHQRKHLTTWDHGGSLPGTTTKIMCRSDGIHWVVLFNSRHDSDGKRIRPDHVQARIQAALGRVKSWPDVDLFRGS